MEKIVVAVFDFDGTITKKDSLLPFLVSQFGWAQVLVKAAPLTPLFFSFFLGLASRKQVKEALFTTFFKDELFEIFQKRCQKYAKTVLPRLVRSEATEKISWHLKQKHILVLASASIESYLIPWALAHGFSHVLASLLEVNGEGFLTGKIFGENCRGQEKVRRLAALFPKRETIEVYAYGDSSGDKELLDFADHSYYRPFR